jgi:predicted methyltransferase
MRGRGGRAGMPSFGAISIALAMVSECFYSGLWKSLRREGIILHKVWYEGVGIKIKNLLINERRKVRGRDS